MISLDSFSADSTIKDISERTITKTVGPNFRRNHIPQCDLCVSSIDLCNVLFLTWWSPSSVMIDYVVVSLPSGLTDLLLHVTVAKIIPLFLTCHSMDLLSMCPFSQKKHPSILSNEECRVWVLHTAKEGNLFTLFIKHGCVRSFYFLKNKLSSLIKGVFALGKLSRYHIGNI